jgi:hypothetical protein
MERKNFLKSLLVGAASTSVLAQACSKDDVSAAESSFTSGTSTSSSSGSSGGYSVASTETEGLFPTTAPASYVRSDIRNDRSGYKLMH